MDATNDNHIGETFKDHHGQVWTVVSYDPNHKFPYALEAWLDDTVRGDWRMNKVKLESYLRRNKLFEYLK